MASFQPPDGPIANALQTRVLAEIEGLLTEADVVLSVSADPDDRRMVETERTRVRVRLQAAVDRIAAGSVYAESARQWTYLAPELVGTVRALRDDIRDNYVNSLVELIHADVFADFLEMALELVGKGYKDPAAVVAGSVLEGHLRHLGGAAGLATTTESGEPLKAERLNADLAKHEAYNKLEQKSVTAWLGLRNDAAHGHYDRYTAERVALMIEGVRLFLREHPA